MSTLERAYASVRSKAFLLNEDFSAEISDDGMKPIPDDQVLPGVPAEYAKYFVPGSGRGSGDTESWSTEYFLKFPFKLWSDGTEDLETTFDYVQGQIKNEMPQEGGNPGGPFCRSSAVVDGEKSNNQEILVRCYMRGGLDI